MKALFAMFLSVGLMACSGDPNGLPKYGKSSNLPANCRAYVQESIDAWRIGEHDTDDTMDALERNCGLDGDLWDYKP